jgi:NADPH-dependent ferric siderophore reductase
MAGEEAQHLGFHVGKVVLAFAQAAVLLRTVQMHDRVHGFQDLAASLIWVLVDLVNLFSHNRGHYQLVFKDDTMKDAAHAPVIQRVRHELKRRELTVASITPLGPGFVSITFQSEDLADFVSMSFDDHVKLLFNDEVRRDYTPRAFSREERSLTIEFALHGHGTASEWARNAQVGQKLAIGGPRGSMIVPLEFDWHLLVGDSTALPAISRRLEELPQDARAFVAVLAGDADRREFSSRARVDVQWVDTADALAEALRLLSLPEGLGFAWGGGEARAMARVRQVLNEKGLPREQTRVSAYWKQGQSDHHETLE